MISLQIDKSLKHYAIKSMRSPSFDLLHPGHLSVLRHAASVCDRLIVGLNADASVKRLKGDNRPINDEMTRATMLASLEMVDRVVIFDEDTPAELIEEVAPHVMIKAAQQLIVSWCMESLDPRRVSLTPPRCCSRSRLLGCAPCRRRWGPSSGL